MARKRDRKNISILENLTSPSKEGVFSQPGIPKEEITPEMGWTKRMEVYGYADFIQIVPAKFLTKQENDDDFDRQVDNHVMYDPIADGDLLDIVHHHLYDLKERGLYEKEIHKEAH